jgi:hypothetical protein
MGELKWSSNLRFANRPHVKKDESEDEKQIHCHPDYIYPVFQ